jgi:hypothetical protein
LQRQGPVCVSEIANLSPSAELFMCYGGSERTH